MGRMYKTRSSKYCLPNVFICILLILCICHLILYDFEIEYEYFCDTQNKLSIIYSKVQRGSKRFLFLYLMNASIFTLVFMFFVQQYDDW
jgi:hypothetical protein